MTEHNNYKVALINYTFGENGRGVSTYAIRLYRELINRDINVEKIATNDILRRVRFGRELKNSLYFLLKANDLKGKNIHSMAPNVIPQKWLNIARKKIVNVHDFYIFEEWYVNETTRRLTRLQEIFYRAFIKRQRKEYYNISKYDFVFVRSEIIKDRLVSKFGVSPEKMAVSNDIIPDKFRPMKMKKSNGKVVIGFINNFTENKTLKLKKFIDVFKGIKDRTLEFRIYGKDFPFSDLICDDKRIKYFGFLPEEDIVRTYNEFSVYLSTSTIEGFGIPIMQAKACNIPVLCYDGDLPVIVKRNTKLWDDDNLEYIIKNRGWENIDMKKAYADASECRPKKVVDKIIRVYNTIY